MLIALGYISLAYLVGQVKQAPHWGVQLRFRVIYVSRYVCRVQKCIDGITWPKHVHALSQIWAVKTGLRHQCYSFRLYARAALAWTKRNVHLEMGNLKQTELQRLKTEERKAEDKTRN